MTTNFPLPPTGLRERVGCLPAGRDNEAGYLELGSESRKAIERVLPAGWTWTGKRVLDFGCGAGRTLRHFGDVAGLGEFYGTDIDEASISWNHLNLAPPFTFTQNDERPPLPLRDNQFDLVYAISVFSHLTAFWAEWLVDLHRVLAPGGLLVATFMGEGLSERIAGQPWDEEQVGMAVYQAGLSWDEGGPMVLLSPWWIREHWGRLFEIDTIFERDFGAGAPIFGPHDHGVVVARKTAMTAGPDDLRRPALGDKRETIALYHEAARLVTEVAALRPQVTALEQHAAYMDEVFGPAKYAALEAERDRLAKLLATTAATSASLPAPTVREAVRALAMALRAWLSRHRSKGSS